MIALQLSQTFSDCFLSQVFQLDFIGNTGEYQAKTGCNLIIASNRWWYPTPHAQTHKLNHQS